MRLRPATEMLEALDDQTHRRFIKTHSPAHTIPLADSLKYITVHRAAPDALVSWGNHRAKMRPEIMQMLNDDAFADGLSPLPLRFEGDYDVLFDEWSQFCSPARHLASWWPLRDESNVLMLHYANLLADLEGEMRCIADYLGLDVDESSWPAVVERCRIASMRNSAREAGRIDGGFEGGANSFFNKGVNGEGTRQLTDAQLERVAAHCADHLDLESRQWLESGRSASS